MRSVIATLASFIALLSLFAVFAQVDGALPVLIISGTVFALTEDGKLPIEDNQ